MTQISTSFVCVQVQHLVIELISLCATHAERTERTLAEDTRHSGRSIIDDVKSVILASKKKLNYRDRIVAAAKL